MFTWVLSLILFTNQMDIVYSCLDATCSKCVEDPTGGQLTQSPYEYYRREEMDSATCVQLCLDQPDCAGIEQHDNKCYKVEPSFIPGIAEPTTQGTAFIKAGECISEEAVKNPPILGRLRREWEKYSHTWGISTGGQPAHSGLCYAINDTSDCSLQKFGVSKDGKTISIDKYDRLLGYCSLYYGECGATQGVNIMKHKTRNDYLYLPDMHPTELAKGLGFEVYTSLGCYFWPGFWNLNCDQIYDI